MFKQKLNNQPAKLFGIGLLSCIFLTTACFSDSPPYLNYWRKIFDEEKPLERPEGKNWELSNKVKTFNEFDGKRVLAFIRQGDYTHAGEEEAIDLIMSYFPKDENRKILDVACGLGGTANYIRNHGWGKVTGFDIESQAIEYAKTTYPEVRFFVADVAYISEVIKEPDFDLICIVNSFVCFGDQLQCLKELRKIAKPETQLLIFEYTDLMESGKNPLVGKGKKASFLPIRPGEVDSLLNQAGWKMSRFVTLDTTFENWYKNFLDLIESKREEIDQKFGENATNFTRGKYDLLYYALKNKWLGGCVMILSPQD